MKLRLMSWRTEQDSADGVFAKGRALLCATLRARRLAALGAFCGSLLVSSQASALLVDADLDIDAATHSDDLIYFYPYRSSYRSVDKRYAFDDDPLSAFVLVPYDWTIELHHTSVRRPMTNPRTSFVPEMQKSAEAL